MKLFPTKTGAELFKREGTNQ